MLSLATVEYITNAATVLMFCTGIPPCLNMLRSGSTRNVPFVLFIVATVSCTNSLYYGLQINNSTVIYLNLIGAVLQFIYSLAYFFVSKNKGDCLSYFGLQLVYFGSVYYYLYSIVVEPDLIRERVGLIASTICTMMLAMPLLEIPGNIMNKNADGVPTVMLLGNCLCSACWFTFGYMLNDPFIYGPNIMGICVMLLKLVIVLTYGGSKTKEE